MLQNHHLAKSLQDAAWRRLIQDTTYKAENAGQVVVSVDPGNTSQSCSGCGERVEKSLEVRVHECPFCGQVTVGIALQTDQSIFVSRVLLLADLLTFEPPIEFQPIYERTDCR